jgi:hypothetical protein
MAEEKAGDKQSDRWKIVERLHHILGGVYYSTHLWPLIAPTLIALAVTAIAATVFIWHLLESTFQTYLALFSFLTWGHAWYKNLRHPYPKSPRFLVAEFPRVLGFLALFMLICAELALHTLIDPTKHPLDAGMLLSISVNVIIVIVTFSIECLWFIRLLWDIFMRLEVLEAITIQTTQLDPAQLRKTLADSPPTSEECYKQFSMFRLVAPQDFPYTPRKPHSDNQSDT